MNEQLNPESEQANWHPSDAESTEAELAARQLDGLETEGPDSEKNLGEAAEATREFAATPEQESTPESRRRNLAREFYTRFEPKMKEVLVKQAELRLAGREEEANELGQAAMAEAKTEAGKFLGEELDGWFAEYEQKNEEAKTEFDGSRKSKLVRLSSDAVDFIPVVGSAKMIAESVYGQTLAGEKLTKGQRALRFAEGSIFLALDLTGVGATASTGLKAGRLATRSAAMMRKVGMKPEVYRAVYKTGRFLIKNPEAGKIADKSLRYILNGREKRKNLLTEEARQEVLNTISEQEEEMAA